jgi:hypothetical protein
MDTMSGPARVYTMAACSAACSAAYLARKWAGARAAEMAATTVYPTVGSKAIGSAASRDFPMVCQMAATTDGSAVAEMAQL